MQVIYVDVLLGTNLFVDFCLLLLNAKFLHLEPKKGRLILGASVGAIGSLIVLVPTMETWVSFIYQLLLAAIITYCAFGFCGRALFLRQLLSFYVMSFAFAGIMLVLWYFLAPKGLFIKNNVVYFDVPPVLFIVLVGVCYFIMRIFHRITGRGAVANIDGTLELSFDGEKRKLRCKVDTGCALKEPFSGLPVIVAERKALPQLPKTPPRPILFSSVGGDGLMRAWKPSNAQVLIGEKEKKLGPCYVAVSDSKLSGGDYEALIPPELLDDFM